ncbi:MAG TPA: hypothetical protein VN736_25970 [Candidatus Limnocylindrales bacterium]|nr:hypothetical protein [Candidatus Limnocylindrales bacterium]
MSQRGEGMFATSDSSAALVNAFQCFTCRPEGAFDWFEFAVPAFFGTATSATLRLRQAGDTAYTLYTLPETPGAVTDAAIPLDSATIPLEATAVVVIQSEQQPSPDLDSSESSPPVADALVTVEASPLPIPESSALSPLLIAAAALMKTRYRRSSAADYSCPQGL